MSSCLHLGKAGEDMGCCRVIAIIASVHKLWGTREPCTPHGTPVPPPRTAPGCPSPSGCCRDVLKPGGHQRQTGADLKQQRQVKARLWPLCPKFPLTGSQRTSQKGNQLPLCGGSGAGQQPRLRCFVTVLVHFTRRPISCGWDLEQGPPQPCPARPHSPRLLTRPAGKPRSERSCHSRCPSRQEATAATSPVPPGSAEAAPTLQHSQRLLCT